MAHIIQSHPPFFFDYSIDSVPLPWLIRVAYAACSVSIVGPDEIFVCQEQEKTPPKRINPWIMRTNMLAARTDAQILKFLDSVGGVATTSPGACFITDAGHFRLIQGVITTMLLSPVSKWESLINPGPEKMFSQLAFTTRQLARPLNMRVEPIKGILAVTVQAQTFLDVVVTTIYIDKLRGTAYRRCAREDCGLIFKVESKHGQRYCQQYCGHLVSVRRQRRALQKAKQHDRSDLQRKES